MKKVTSSVRWLNRGILLTLIMAALAAGSNRVNSQNRLILLSYAGQEVNREASTSAQILSASQSQVVKETKDSWADTLRNIPVKKIHAVAFSPDGRWLAIADDRQIKILNVQLNQIVHVIQPFSQSRSKPVTLTLAFSPDNQTLFSGSQPLFNEKGDNATVNAWNVDTGQLRYRLPLHSDVLTDMAVSPDGQTLLVKSGRRVELWSLSTRKLLRTVYSDTDESISFSVAFSPDGQTVAASILPGPGKFPDIVVKQPEIIIWNSTTGEQIRSILLNSYVWDISFSPDAQVLAAALDKCNPFEHCLPAGENAVQLINAQTGQQIRTLSVEKYRYEEFLGYWSIAFSPDGSSLVAGGGSTSNKIAGLWDLNTGTLLHSVVEESLDGANPSRIDAVAFSPSGQFAVLAGSDWLRAWDIRKLQSKPRSL